MSQTTLAIPKQQNSFKQVKPKTIVGKGENHYVQQEQQQAQHPRGQGRYEQVQDGSRQRPVCTSTILKIAEEMLLKLLKIDKLAHKKWIHRAFEAWCIHFLCQSRHEAK